MAGVEKRGRVRMRDLDNGKKKQVIFYSRDYRKVGLKRTRIVVFLLAGLLPVVLGILFFYSRITFSLASWAQNVVSQVLKTEVWLETASYIPHLGDVTFAVAEAGYPSYTVSLLCVIFSLLGIVILSQVKSGWKPLMIYLTVGMIVFLASGLFFLFLADYFPYRMTHYSELYIKQQVSLWLMIALSSGIAIALPPSSLLSKFLCFGCTMLYSFVFGCIRYAVFLVILKWGTMLLMAPLFFIFGVLFDFLQMIAIYSIFTRYISGKMNDRKGEGDWEWS